MYIADYTYTVGDYTSKDSIVFSTELRENNKGYNNCSKYFKQFCVSNTLLLANSKTYILYISGPSLSSTFSTITDLSRFTFKDSTTTNYLNGYTGPLIRTLSCSMLHMYEKQLITTVPTCKVIGKETIDFACASGGYAIARAEELLDTKNIEQVIIVGEEIITFNTYALFKENNIDLLLGDGFAAAILNNTPSDYQISNFIKYNSYNINPFHVDCEGYSKVYTGVCNYVKLHGTGTNTNTIAEAEIIQNSNIPIYYKYKIGHTQGLSAFVETLMLLNDTSIRNNSTIEVLASGFGGYYIGYTVSKNKKDK